MEGLYIFVLFESVKEISAETNIIFFFLLSTVVISQINVSMRSDEDLTCTLSR